MPNTIQVMTQLLAVEGERANLGSWCLSHLAPKIAKNNSIHELTVNIAQPSPLPELYPNESCEGDDFAVILQIGAPSLEVWKGVLRPFNEALEKGCRKRFDYQITSTTVKFDKSAFSHFNPSPGYKLLRGLVFHDDLPSEAARRQWAHHSNLATRVHIGVARYTQHMVEKVLTPEAPQYDGFSDLHFPSLEAMRDRYFDSLRGKEEIMHDIGHFIAKGSKRFYGQEFRIK